MGCVDICAKNTAQLQTVEQLCLEIQIDVKIIIVIFNITTFIKFSQWILICECVIDQIFSIICPHSIIIIRREARSIDDSTSGCIAHIVVTCIR
ncbi:hypothetical protein D3C73_969590 [compost metagenome]